jgi:hypothetical protein
VDEVIGQGQQIGLDELDGFLPPEDAGAVTQSLYLYQAEVIARYVVGLSKRASIRAVVCEWLEDFIVVYQDKSTLLGSVKHRETSQGPFSVSELLTDGGLKHLFDRWKGSGKRSRCILCTNAGLKSDAKSMQQACAEGDAGGILSSAQAIWQRLVAEDAAEAAAFLTILRIDHDLPGRRHIEAHNLHHYVRPLLARRYTGYSADRVYRAIVELVQEHSRDRAAGTHDFIDIIADADRLNSATIRDRRLEARILRYGDVANAIAAGRPTGPTRLPMPATISHSTVLAQKLEAGLLGPTLLESAQQLRASWTEFEAGHGDDLGVDPDLEDLKIRVLAAAGRAETEAKQAVSPGESYGIEMYRALVDIFASEAFQDSCTMSVDPPLVEGCAYDLTDNCRIWWSPKFDVGAA